VYRSQLEQVRQTSKNFYEVAEGALDKVDAANPGARAARKSLLDGVALESFGATAEAFDIQNVQEAIILAELRPAYFVLESGIDLKNAVAGDPDLVAVITQNKILLESACQSVGRVDLINHWTLPYAGTGFLIDDNIAVTNRHVAREFAEAIWNGYRFKHGRFGQPMEARLDYRHLHRSQSHQRAEVEEVLYIATDQEPDFALLKVRNLDEVPPLILSATPAPDGAAVAVIGYPAEDADRNEKELMDELFGAVYRVKRFAPGFITGKNDDQIVLMSDYSSLGGNSGSPVCSLETGEVVALHFAGRFKETNYAVAADVLAAASRQMRLTTQAASALLEKTPATSVSDLAGRNGYDPEFLGSGEKRVELPRLGIWAADAAPVEGSEENVLKYTNFSTVQSISRRLPLVTAVNIDGVQSKRLRRKGDWRLDGRLKLEHQIGNQLYRSNPLDRGHMVRRRDPGWGMEAQQAEIDTFHYTNCVPQHEDLNQKDWVGLEDYVLEAAETEGFRATVFTGPIFRDSDERLRDQPGAEDVQIPEEFWKIAVIVNEPTGALSATGYVLSHGPFIRDLVESPFVYGSYRTYQIQIAKIEAETGLTFGTLAEADPLGAEVNSEAPFAQVAREIDGPESLILAPPVS